MEIKIKREDLQRKPFMLGTPAYGGQLTVPYHISVVDLTSKCNELGIPIKNCLIENESLITRARNNIAHTFLNNDNFQYLIFIDADIRFDSRAILQMLALCDENEYPLLAASYPKKRINWDLVHKAVRKGATPQELYEFADSPVMNFVPNENNEIKFNMNELMEVKETGTGFMIIHKSVFRELRKAYPENYYYADYSLGLPEFDNSDRKVHNFFDVGVVKDDIYDNGKRIQKNRYLSEDYYFIRNWKNINPEKNKVYVLPWINLVHHGSFQYSGNLKKTLYVKSLKD